MKDVAIGNKRAAVQGMPKAPKEEAEHIMKAILEMKGAQTKKHKQAHEQGSLALHRKPLTFRGVAMESHKDMAKHEDRTMDGVNVKGEL